MEANSTTIYLDLCDLRGKPLIRIDHPYTLRFTEASHYSAVFIDPELFKGQSLESALEIMAVQFQNARKAVINSKEKNNAKHDREIQDR